MDPSTITAIGAMIAVAIQSFVTWRKNQAESTVKVDEMLDQRIVREFERLDRELQTLRDNQKTMVKHINTLEAELIKHGIPFTPLEIL